MQATSKQFNKSAAIKIIFVVCMFLIAVCRIYPLIKFGETGLGYDTGFYRHYLELNQKSFLTSSTAGLNYGATGTLFILNILSLFNSDANTILFVSYIFFFLLLGWTVYLLAGQIFQDQKAAIFALILFVLSSAHVITKCQFLSF